MENEIGKRIRKIRTEKNMTQNQLAKICDISLSALNKYERNERIPKIDTLEKIAEGLEVQLNYLVGRSQYQRFDSQLMESDISNLIKKIEKKDAYISKLIRNIVDTTYITVNNHIDDENIEILETIHGLYRNIWTIKQVGNNEDDYKILTGEELDKNTTPLEALKEKNNLLLDKLNKSLSEKGK